MQFAFHNQKSMPIKKQNKMRKFRNLIQYFPKEKHSKKTIL